jgi:putative DNA primase/helicase
MLNTRTPLPPLQRTVTPELVRDALGWIPPDVDRDTWVRMGMAIKAEMGGDGFDLWDAWSQQSKAYSASAAKEAWKSIKAGGRVKIGTLFQEAKGHGFKFPAPDDVQASAPPDAAALAERERLALARQRQQDAEAEAYSRRADEAAGHAAKLWAQASEQGESAYLVRKGVQAHGVRFLPDGTLLVPMRNAAGELQNVQRIAPHKPTPAQEQAGLREKLFLPGGRKSGLWHLVGDVAGAPVVALVEGFATGATVHEATGLPVAVCFDAGNLVHVAKALRVALPDALLLVCGDDDRDTEARTGRNPGRDKAATAARAAQVGGGPAGVVFPVGLPAGGSDMNDLAAHAGLEAVRVLVAQAIAAPTVPKPRRGTQAAAGGAQEGGDMPAQGGTPQNAATARKSRRPIAPGAAAGAGGAGGAGGGQGGGGADDGDDATTAPAGRAPGRDPFEVSDSGVYFVARDADGNEKPPLWICAPLRVTARTRAEDANGWGSLLEWSDLDGNAKTWAMPSSLLSGEGSEWAARLRDMGLQMAPGTRPRNLVAQYIDTRNPPERVTCTDRVGWHPGGVYVLPSSCIGTAEGRRYVFQSEAGMEDTYRRTGTLADWQQHVGRLCQGNTRLVFGLGCSFAGPLLRLAGLESGGFHFRSDSSQGKTTVLKVAASAWGRPTYMQRWRTTENALESTAVQHCDGLLILDEIGQVDGRVVGDCAYLLANEQEKGRSTRGGMNRKRRTWRLLFLSSGEKSMAQHMEEAGKRVMAGQEVRMVDIPLDAGVGLGGLETLHEHEDPGYFSEEVMSASARYYGTAGRAWLEWLAPRFDTLTERVATLLDEQRRVIVPDAASGQVRRVGARFALVAVAGELAIEAGIAPWPAGHAAHAARACFRDWLAARGHMDNGEDAQMLRQVRAFLEKNGDALFTYTHRAMDDHRGNTPLRAGFKRLVGGDGEALKIDSASEYFESKGGLSRERAEAQVEYLILPEAFRRDVCKGFDHKAVAELLRKRGHLKHEPDRLTIKHRIPGMDRVPVFHVKPSIFTDEL